MGVVMDWPYLFGSGWSVLCFLHISTIQEFNPLRFTEENSKGRSPHAFIAFSAGPRSGDQLLGSSVYHYMLHLTRNCIGQEFALNEEKVVISHILRNFELTLDTEKPVVKEFLIILRPKGGLYLKLKHRRH